MLSEQKVSVGLPAAALISMMLMLGFLRDGWPQEPSGLWLTGCGILAATIVGIVAVEIVRYRRRRDRGRSK